MRAVDLCCGDGWFTLPIAKVAWHAVAIDIEPSLLEIARQWLNGAKLANCDFVTGDAYMLADLVPEPADFIFMANAFHGVPDRSRLADAVRAALRPGGEFAVVNWHQHAREETTVLGEPRGPRTALRLSPRQTIRDVEAGGLKFSRLVEIPPYHYGAMFERRTSR